MAQISKKEKQLIVEHHTRVQSLPWWGGKQFGSKAKWIAGLLPWHKDSTYIETHGGMASVMATRAAVRYEIYNDIDGNAVNWWRMWRESPGEMTRLVTFTPHSREEFENAIEDLTHSDSLRRAWAFHVCKSQTIGAASSSKGRWLCYQDTTPSGNCREVASTTMCGLN